MFTSYEPYLLKCFSTHFGCALCIKIIHVVRKILLDVGKKAAVWASPLWVLSTYLYSPCSYLHSPSSALSTLWLCHMNHPPQHLLKLFQQPDTLAPCSLSYKLRCISSSRSSHIGCQAGFPDFPSLGGCSASVELEHWFLSRVAFLLFYRNCYLLCWCS